MHIFVLTWTWLWQKMTSVFSSKHFRVDLSGVEFIISNDCLARKPSAFKRSHSQNKECLLASQITTVIALCVNEQFFHLFYSMFWDIFYWAKWNFHTLAYKNNNFSLVAKLSWIFFSTSPLSIYNRPTLLIFKKI